MRRQIDVRHVMQRLRKEFPEIEMRIRGAWSKLEIIGEQSAKAKTRCKYLFARAIAYNEKPTKKEWWK